MDLSSNDVLAVQLRDKNFSGNSIDTLTGNLKSVQAQLNSGITSSFSIPLAKLTGGGSNGSMTIIVKNGLITTFKVVQPT